jgi:hypothetical protein
MRFQIADRGRNRKRRFIAELETLEDRWAPALITLTGAGQFQDGPLAGLINTGGDNYAAINLRSAIAGAESLAEPSTIILQSGATYTMDGTDGPFLVSNPSGSLTIASPGPGRATINAEGLSRAFLNQTNLTLIRLQIENGVAGNWGGAILNEGILNLQDCQLLNNEALGDAFGDPVEGGAIYNAQGSIFTAQNCTFSGNAALGGSASVLSGPANAEGGALFFAGGPQFVTDTLLDSTFSNNEAVGGNGYVVGGLGAPGGYGAGGAIFGEAGNYSLNIINDTLAYNLAQGGNGAFGDGGNGSGGGLFLSQGGLGTTLIVNDTVALNSAAGGTGSGYLPMPGLGSGGGLADNFQTGPGPKMINTIVGQNHASIDNDVTGLWNSLGHNLVGDNTGAQASFNAATGDFVGSAAKPLSANIDPLANYGGPTATFRLRPGSPAIDRGNNIVALGPLNLTTDERGQPRRSGGTVDIGAYEVTQSGQNKTYTIAENTTLTTTVATGLLAGYDNPLKQTVTVQLAPGSGPAAGKLTLNSNGTFTYKPPAQFFGTVPFRFIVVVDGQELDTYTVTITVTPPKKK